MYTKLSASLLALVLAGVVASPALAQHHDPHGGGPGFGAPGRDDGPRHWRGDISRFHDDDFDFWRGGRWFHGPHDGRDGWWWLVGDVWYFYSAPIYPYPDPYTPPMVVVEPVQAGATVYWYCPSTASYYPYVASCPTPWQRRLAGGDTIVVTPSVTPTTMVVNPEPVTTSAAQPDQRTQDDRQLNSLGTEFAQIDLTLKKTALRKLNDLEDRVEFFRKSLLSRSYNAMDILRDTESLRDRISAKEAELKVGKK